MRVSFREPVNGLTHLAAALAAAVGTILLVVGGWGDITKILALGAYGASLTLLFGASAAYHLSNLGPRGIAVLRQLDHSAIYLLIAGTYTPFCLIAFGGFWRWGLFAIIWSLAAIGIIVKVFYMGAPRCITAGVYVIMGWICIAATREMLRTLPPGALAWLLAGGVIYTLGAAVYITRKLDFWPGRFGFHEVWHIFVILGALAHFVAIAAYVARVAS